MIFLLEYSRTLGRLVTFKRFADADRTIAERARLDLELSRNREDVQTEIVLLEASTEAALRKTHRRYFESARQIIESSTGTLG
jgi:hypothetical protein